MPTRYYITPYDPASWRDPDVDGDTSSLKVFFMDFSNAARSVWSSYQAHPSFSWSITFLDDVMIDGGFIGEGKQVLILSQPMVPSHWYDFIIWYRTFIPIEYSLFLFAEGSWNSLKLTDKTTASDIREFTGLD